MGACVSANTVNGACETAAILILCQKKKLSDGNGDVQFAKYTEKIRVAEAIKEHQREEECFICSWDNLCCGERIPELKQWQELQMGEIYFLLPRTKLSFLLTIEDMSSLLLKAATVLKSLPYSPLCITESVGLVGKEERIRLEDKKIKRNPNPQRTVGKQLQLGMRSKWTCHLETIVEVA